MKRYVFLMVVGCIWILIFCLGILVFQRVFVHREGGLEEAKVDYDWEAILDKDMVCVDEIEREMVVPYSTIARLMEQMSDGMFQDVQMEKTELLVISLRVVGKGKYYEEFADSYPELAMVFPLLESMVLEIECNPTFEDTMLLQIEKVNVGILKVPESFYDLFRVLEKEVNQVIKGIDPFEIYEYQWKQEGLYWRIRVPKRIERNSMAVFYYLYL